MAEKKGLIITVNFNSHEETINYLLSLSQIDQFNCLDVIIADNSSSMDHFNVITRFIDENDWENISIIKMEKNLGYFGAVRFILDNNNQNKSLYEFIIVSNNDIIIKDKNIIDNILFHIDKAEVFAPKIINIKNQRNQNPFQISKHNIKNEIFHIFYYSSFFMAKAILGIRNILIRRKLNDNSSEKEMPIYAGHGSFLIFSNSFFKKGGYIDNNFFLYAEENTLAEIVLKINGIILYVPDIVIFHESRGTVARRLTKEKYLIQKDAYEYFNNNYGES